jgi:hypothetical protein
MDTLYQALAFLEAQDSSLINLETAPPRTT